MRQFFKISLLTCIIFFSLVIILFNFGVITFGSGLGDLFYFLVHCGWLFALILTHVLVKKGKIKPNTLLLGVLTVFFALSIVASILGFTIYRGTEYPWNGKIFVFPYILQEHETITDF